MIRGQHNLVSSTSNALPTLFYLARQRAALAIEGVDDTYSGGRGR